MVTPANPTMTSKLETIAVFDVGKTSSKVVLLDRTTLEEIATRRQENQPQNGAPYAYLDTERQWKFLCTSLQELQAMHGVGAIAITTHGATAALVCDDGLATPILDYEYQIPEECSQAYASIRPPFEQTYSPRLPVGLNLGAQLFFLKTDFPDEFAKTGHVLMFPQYWCWRLTGIARSECTSLGTHTDLWEPDTHRFSTLIGTQFPTSMFPEIAKAHELFPLSNEAALQTGLLAGTPVTIGIHDSNASLFPWLGATQKTSIISSGTWTIVMSPAGSLDGLDQDRDMLANVDALGRPVPTARFMGGREFEILTAGDPAAITMQDIENAIKTNTMALPGIVSGVGPFPHGKGGWDRAEPNTLPLRTAGATLYIALMTDTCLRLAGTGERIIVEGPFAKNQLFIQLLASLTGNPVYASGDATGTATGAAMLLTEPREPDLPDAVEPADIDGLKEYASRWRALARQANSILCKQRVNID